MEGDAGTVVWAQVWDDFYPRPPGGGRPCSAAITRRGGHFYPRPPGGGRHNRRRERHCPRNFYPRPPGGGRLPRVGFFYPRRTLISIHALRVEGDTLAREKNQEFFNFYPRPPGGGRLWGWIVGCKTSLFLSTPSGWRATSGDLVRDNKRYKFLSTPSGWRATAKTDKVFVCFCAKGRRICLFKTRKERICRWRFKKDKFWVLIWCEGSGKGVCASVSHCG